MTQKRRKYFSSDNTRTAMVKNGPDTQSRRRREDDGKGTMSSSSDGFNFLEKFILQIQAQTSN